MATEIVRHVSPAFQVRTGADSDKSLDIEVRHPYVPWRFTGLVYRRDFDGADTTIKLFQTFRGDADAEVEIFSQTLGAGSFQADLDRTVELAHEQGVRFESSGGEPGAGEKHLVILNWEERLDQSV